MRDVYKELLCQGCLSTETIIIIHYFKNKMDIDIPLPLDFQQVQLERLISSGFGALQMSDIIIIISEMNLYELVSFWLSLSTNLRYFLLPLFL